MDIHEKINLKVRFGASDTLNKRYTGMEVADIYIRMLQIPVGKYDVISENPNLFVHKHVIGRFFTYRISSDPVNEFTRANSIRAGQCGIKMIFITK
jgi:hypothetical protein